MTSWQQEAVEAFDALGFTEIRVWGKGAEVTVGVLRIQLRREYRVVWTCDIDVGFQRGTCGGFGSTAQTALRVAVNDLRERTAQIMSALERLEGAA